MSVLLLLSLCFLSSCSEIRNFIKGDEAGTGEDEELWNSEQIYSAAMAILDDKVGGIVDISKAKYSYDEMCGDLKKLAETYPSHFSYRSIGKTVAGRDIQVGILGNPQAERQLVVSASIHAREYMTALLVMRQIEFYLENYNTGTYNGTAYKELFENTCVYIIPMTNPDGVMIAQEGLESLPTEELKQTVRNVFETEGKENGYTTLSVFLSHWKANANGVDLNRNYDALWEEYKKGEESGVTGPNSYQYKGPYAVSENETRAVVDFVNGLANPIAVLCMHTQGEVVYWDCGQNGEIRNATKAYAEVVGTRTGYEVIYEQNNDASLSDWAVLKKEIVSITVEVGTGSYPMPIARFPKIWTQNYDLIPLTLAHFESTERR